MNTSAQSALAVMSGLAFGALAILFLVLLGDGEPFDLFGGS